MVTIKKYVKLPAVVEAVQYDGTEESGIAIQKWSREKAVVVWGFEQPVIRVANKHEALYAHQYDWILKDEDGEFTVVNNAWFKCAYAEQSENKS